MRAPPATAPAIVQAVATRAERRPRRTAMPVSNTSGTMKNSVASAKPQSAASTISPMASFPGRELPFGGEIADATVEVGHERSLVAGPAHRFTDENTDEERHRQQLASRQHLAEPVQEDRKDRHVRISAREVRDAVLEGAQPLRLAARALRKEDEDVAAGKRRIGRRERVGAPGAAFARQRNDADDVERKPGQAAALQEVVGGDDRPQAREQPLREQRHQHERVEMAVVVGGDDRGATRRQALAMAGIDAEQEQREGA